MERGGGVRGTGREQAGWRMLTRGFENLKHVTPLMKAAVGVGVVWALLSIVAAVDEFVLVIVGIFSGPMVALYGTILHMSRDARIRTLVGGLFLVLTGLSHMAWTFWIARLLRHQIPFMFGSDLRTVLMGIAITGVVFSMVIACCTASWRALIGMLAGTLAASTLGAVGTLSSEPTSTMGLAIAVLHLSIVATLLFTTLATIAARERPGVCKSCGYDLAGNVGGVCPECGFDALHPPPHPFDLEVRDEPPRV